MILSAEALEIINYLKTDPGRFVSLLEISRRAGGRRRFEQSHGWARNLMSSLIDAGLIEVNARGHYRATGSAQPHGALKASDAPTRRTPSKRQAKVVGEDYFPTNTGPQIVAGDYFPD